MDHPPKKPFPWASTLIATFLLIFLGLMAYGPIMRSAKATKLTEAIINAKQISFALIAFAEDHEGQFPNDATGSADTSEACFTQLLEGKYITDEKFFYNPIVAEKLSLPTTPPNNDGKLTPGENTLGYIKGLTTKSRPITPIIFDSSTSPGTFSTATWGGKAIIVRLDGSTTAKQISYKGKPYDKNDNPKQGPILEDQEHGENEINIFSPQYLPEGTEILLPKKP